MSTPTDYSVVRFIPLEGATSPLCSLWTWILQMCQNTPPDDLEICGLRFKAELGSSCHSRQEYCWPKCLAFAANPLQIRSVGSF